MSESLKSGNNRSVFLLLGLPILLSAGLQLGVSELEGLIEFIAAGTAVAALPAALVMITNLLPSSLKHKMVFLRPINEMPACRIDKLVKGDPRISLAGVRNQWPEVFDPDIEPGERNSRWYQQIYKAVKALPEVLESHSKFLLYRDVFSGLVILLLAALVWAWFGSEIPIGPPVDGIFYLLGGFAIASLIAAQNKGKRFAVNVVAAAI